MRLALVSITALIFTTAALAKPITGPVTTVQDGDTITVGQQKIRLCGISAPELREKGGKESRQTMTRLALGKTARCVPVGEGTPCDGRSDSRSYDRIVATCMIGGRDVARAMIEARAACDWPKFSGGTYGGPGECER